MLLYLKLMEISYFPQSKSNHSIFRGERKTDRQTGKQTDRQTDTESVLVSVRQTKCATFPNTRRIIQWPRFQASIT